MVQYNTNNTWFNTIPIPKNWPWTPQTKFIEVGGGGVGIPWLSHSKKPVSNKISQIQTTILEDTCIVTTQPTAELNKITFGGAIL